ncbi:MAG: methyltransferase domain-containing protein [Rhodospirillaceae bacterium]
MNAASVKWKPDVYLNFAAYRARPVEDLLPRITLTESGPIYDLGCGPGNITVKLKERWPAHEITGMDSSADMLGAALRSFPAGIMWEPGDIATWAPPAPAALIFSNAALHWVPDHERLFPRLARGLAPGGVFAAQMPVGKNAPYHLCLDEIARAPRWAEKLGKGLRQRTPLPPAGYYDLLADLMSEIDVWETDYHHELEGEDPVAAWAAGTALRPYTSLLDEEEAADFTAAYAARLREAYPPQKNGRTLFCMRRIFIVARRRP